MSRIMWPILMAISPESRVNLSKMMAWQRGRWPGVFDGITAAKIHRRGHIFQLLCLIPLLALNKQRHRVDARVRGFACSAWICNDALAYPGH